MFRAEGYSIITAPGERAIEQDTYTCGHCNAISFTKPLVGGTLQVAVVQNDGSVRMQPAGFCRKCWRWICPRCEAAAGRGFECVPLEAKIEAEEAAARKLIMP